MTRTLLLVSCLFLFACRPTVDYPGADKVSGFVAQYTLPEPLPPTQNDVILAGENPTTNLNLCAADYLQVQFTAISDLPGTARLLYAGDGQDYYTWVAPEIALQAGEHTYALPTDRLHLWRTIIDAVQVESDAEITGLRVIHDGDPDSACDPLPVTYSEDDYVFDFNSSDLRVTGVAAYDIDAAANTLLLQPATDPAIYNQDVLVCAADYTQVVLRMRVSADINQRVMQFFWARGWTDFSQVYSIRLPVIADGEFHEYVIPVELLRGWGGIMRGLRLDPVPLGNPDAEDNIIEITDFRLMRRQDLPTRCDLTELDT